ncbi:MAG: FAD-binding oxidoreductase [Verrucomicrobia bacterium]|nr:MAG: FAD-binding oxidoreductase [Verrucomicrobiota bacterium]
MFSDFIFENVAAEHPDFLRDESRRTGRAAALAMPRTAEELRAALQLARARGWTITAQGGRTGLTGGAVPDGGLIISLGRMNRVLGLRQTTDGAFMLTVQPGVVLQDLRRILVAREFDTRGWSADSLAVLEALRAAPLQFFPPDPTETTATLGGMAACNASGACTFRYGATRNHIAGFRLMLADGDALVLRRGKVKAQGRAFALETESHRKFAGHLPAYAMPQVKNAAGYFAADNMDLLDLFIGAEGTLGIFTELELRLMPEPGTRWGLMAFFPDQTLAVQFVNAARATNDARLAALEFFDARALDLLRAERARSAALLALSELSPHFHTAIYAEIHAGDDDAAAAVTEQLLACGVDEKNSWLATNAHDMEKFKAFRHALPEAVNGLIDERRKTEPSLTKLGTDMAVPDAYLDTILERYERDLQAANLEYVIFGHIGNNHLHVNILPRSRADYQRGRELYLVWARDVVRLGGTVAAEHGIGKLKAPMLEIMLGPQRIAEMRALKRVFDPAGCLGHGNLFST